MAHHLPQLSSYPCTRCQQTKPLEDFYLDGRKKSGVSSWCKDCSKTVAQTTAKQRKAARVKHLSSLYKVPKKEVDD